jgi:hypothetical protein
MKLRWAGNVAEMEERRDVHGILVGNPFHRRTLGRPKRWENNIKLFLKIDYGDKSWMELTQNRMKWNVD